MIGSIFPVMLQSLGLFTLAVFPLNALQHRMAERQRGVVVGVVFGLCAVGSMSMPVVVGDGVILDLRNVMMALAAPTGGLLAAGIALAVAAVFRFWVIGGAGAFAGIAGMVICIGVGHAIAVVAADYRRHPLFLLALGLVPGASMISFFLLPREQAIHLLLTVGPAFAVSNFVGVLVLGLMLTQERRRAQRERLLSKQASTDALTGLANRLAFDVLAPALVTAEHAGQRALAIIDVDHFKSVNDTFGHAAGDAVLREVARLISDAVPDAAMVARLGGEEFVIVYPCRGVDEALFKAECVRTAVSAGAHDVRGISLTVSVSIGTQLCMAGKTLQDLLEDADMALYTAKSSGRNQTRLASAA